MSTVTTKFLVDGGDPAETQKIKSLVGHVDGQTTNPSLVAKNPEIARRVAAGHKLTKDEQLREYKKIVQTISPLVGTAGVSIEVFADLDTKAADMLSQGEEMFSWIPNAYIKYPTTTEGLKAAHASVAKGMRVNMTLCFTQPQAAAVYAATKGSKYPVYVSPFIGRLDDRGENGMDIIKNIKKMFADSDHHVHVLAASIRHLDHLLYSFALGAELATAPAKVWEEWADKSCPAPGSDFSYKALDKNGKPLAPIAYQEVDLNQPWESYNLQHELTTRGIRQFVADYKATLKDTTARSA